MPTRWYNILPDLPEPPPPPLHPGTHEPVGPDDLAPLFPMALIGQEVSQERYIDIPGAVLDVYRLWRPTPLYRARRLEKALGTPARIYFKYEGVSPAGSHKPNTAVPQAYYNAQEGTQRLTTETGAGQWGSALAFACAPVRAGAARSGRSPPRTSRSRTGRTMMETWGATVHSSPSTLTNAGRAILAEDPDSHRQPRHRHHRGGRSGRPGRGHASTPSAACSTTSCMHQTVIGEEALEAARRWSARPPTSSSGAPAAGRTSAGWSFPFLREKLAGQDGLRSSAASSRPPARRLTKGEYRYDFGDTAGPDAAGEDAHPGPRLHPRPDPRRRAALPRHVARWSPPVRARPGRGRGDRSGRVLRGRRPVRPDRGHRPGAGADPRDRVGGPRGPQVQRDRRGRR